MQSLLSASGGLSGGQSGGRSRCSSRHRQDVFRLNYAVRAIVLGKKNSLRHWLQMHDRSNSDHLHLVAKDSLGGTLLHYAAWFNAPEMAQLLITYGADPNVKTWYDTTPLHVACYKGHTDIAQMLIDDGADTDAPLTCGWSPLHLATHRRQFKTIRQLVENKANPSVAVENGITPLHLAADWGQLNLVRSIISLNVDPNVTAEYNQLTPLHLACEQNHYKVVEYLINARANPNVFTSYSGATPLHVACRNGSHEIVSLLLRNGADIKLRDTQGFTAVHYALKSNSIHVLKCLLSDWSLPPNCTIGTDDQKHMLQDACEHGHEKAVELLLKWNASPDIVDAHGRTAVHYAAASGNTYIINHLDKAGAHLQNLDSYLDTPLHLACKNGRLNAVQSLVERGLKLDSLNETRKTPLYLASSVGHSNIVEYLINKGASVNLKDHKGFNCLDVAIEKENKEVVMAIIRSRQWKNALRNSRQDVQGNGETTPFRRMILKMPDLAEIVMNRCIQTNSTIQLHSSMHIRPDHKDYRVTFNYEFLDDARCPFGKVHPWASPKLKQTGHPLYVISNKERYLHLLRHPLIQRLVLFKWRQYAVRFAMANIVLYAIFLLFLTAYALNVPKPFDEMCNQAKNHSRNTSAVDCEDLTPLRRHFLNTAFVVIYTNGFLRLFSEAVQLYQLGIHYFFDWVNFVENGLYIFSLVFAYPFGDGDECYCLSVFQWKVGVLVMLTAWCVILLLLENTYTIGVYVLMFRTIIRTFVRVILLGAFILCGFAISFVMIFEQPKCDTFTTLHNGIVTTITMFSGELNYDNFLQATCHHPFLDVALIVWVLFVILITILLANMLVGLAVGDVKDILDKSTLRRTKLQVDLILTIDAVLPSKFLPSSATVWEEDLEPNEYKLNSQLFEKYKWWRALLVILKGKIFTWGQLGVEIEPDELEQHAMTTELVQESQRFSKELRYELRKGLKDHTCRMQQREKAQVEKSAQDFRKHTQSVSATQRLEFERFCKPMFSAVTDQLNEMREAISELKLQLHDKSKPSAKEQ